MTFRLQWANSTTQWIKEHITVKLSHGTFVYMVVFTSWNEDSFLLYCLILFILFIFRNNNLLFRHLAGFGDSPNNTEVSRQNLSHTFFSLAHTNIYAYHTIAKEMAFVQDFGGTV